MNPFINPSEFNGKIISIEQCIHLYFDMFIDQEDQNLDDQDIKFFLRSQNINDFFFKKEDPHNIYYIPFWEAIHRYPKRDSKKIQIILDSYTFLRSILNIHKNIKIYKIPFSFNGNLNNLENYLVVGEERIYCLNEEFNLFFKNKGSLDKEEMYFSANIYAVMRQTYDSMKQPVCMPSLIQILDRFKLFLHKKHKEKTWLLKRKQIEDELEQFYHDAQGFTLTKEQKNAIVQFCLFFMVQDPEED